MRKVGIITVFDVDNYGNRLQAYALSKALEKLNCEAAEIHYCNNAISLLKAFIKRNYVIRMILSVTTGILKREKNILARCQRLKLFFDFIKKHKIKSIHSDNSSIDYYICGSDQIWNPIFTGTPYYFAAFAQNTKRISYAASFGLSTLPDNVVDEYRTLLTGMSHISVRELAGAKIVNDITGRNAQVVLDPTLLLDKQDWCAMSKKPTFPIEDNYILTYFLSWYSDETKDYIKKIAEENHLHIINLHNFDKNQFWYHTGPAEFIWLIENASLVCTDSFHATVFSIIMESPFIVFKRDLKKNDMHSRLENLLNTFDLGNRFYDNLKKGDEWNITFDHIPPILYKERQKSIDYLTSALHLTEEIR